VDEGDKLRKEVIRYLRRTLHDGLCGRYGGFFFVINSLLKLLWVSIHAAKRDTDKRLDLEHHTEPPNYALLAGAEGSAPSQRLIRLFRRDVQEPFREYLYTLDQIKHKSSLLGNVAVQHLFVARVYASYLFYRDAPPGALREVQEVFVQPLLSEFQPL